MNFRPLDDRVLVRPEKAADQTATGIVLVQSDENAPRRGEVLAVGPGAVNNGVRMPVNVTTGDTVGYSRYGGQEIDVDGEELLLLRESDILGVFS